MQKFMKLKYYDRRKKITAKTNTKAKYASLNLPRLVSTRTVNFFQFLQR